MSKTKKTKHPCILETVHETARGLRDANIINATSVREYNDVCTRTLELTADQAKEANAEVREDDLSTIVEEAIEWARNH